MPLEVLNFSFVFLSRLPCGERSEIPAPIGFGIFFARIQPVFA
jgi:hypothetical protein